MQEKNPELELWVIIPAKTKYGTGKSENIGRGSLDFMILVPDSKLGILVCIPYFAYWIRAVKLSRRTLRTAIFVAEKQGWLVDL